MSITPEKLRYDPNERTLMPAELRWRCEEAADRIEALEAENARLRAALTPSADRPLRYCDYCKAWQSKPCGEGCVWTPACPTLEQRAALPHP